jgi:hypothetical protein
MASLLTILEAHDKLSGWAQFAGASVGLFVAIWLPHRERRAEAHAAAAADLQRLHLLAQQGFQFITNVRSRLEQHPGHRPTFDEIGFDHIRRGLADLPTHRLSADNMARAFKIADILGQISEWRLDRWENASALDWQRDAEPIQSFAINLMRLKKKIEIDLEAAGLATPDWLALEA